MDAHEQVLATVAALKNVRDPERRVTLGDAKKASEARLERARLNDELDGLIRTYHPEASASWRAALFTDAAPEPPTRKDVPMSSNDPWSRARASAEKRLAAPPPEPAEEDAAHEHAAIHEQLTAAVERWKAAAPPKEKRSFYDAGLAARSRIDRDGLEGELVELGQTYLSHFPDTTADKVVDWWESLAAELNDDAA